jgi:hypothetical protein
MRGVTSWVAADSAIRQCLFQFSNLNIGEVGLVKNAKMGVKITRDGGLNLEKI